jgi:hypothetical protein
LHHDPPMDRRPKGCSGTIFGVHHGVSWNGRFNYAAGKSSEIVSN